MEIIQIRVAYEEDKQYKDLEYIFSELDRLNIDYEVKNDNY